MSVTFYNKQNKKKCDDRILIWRYNDPLDRTN